MKAVRGLSRGRKLDFRLLFLKKPRNRLGGDRCRDGWRLDIQCAGGGAIGDRVSKKPVRHGK